MGAFAAAALTFCWGTLELLSSIGNLLTGDEEDKIPGDAS